MYYLLVQDHTSKKLVPQRNSDANTVLFHDFDVAQDTALQMVDEGSPQVAVLDIDTEEIVCHYLYTPADIIDLTQPPEWVIDFLALVNAVETSKSMSDRDAMEHELVRSVLAHSDKLAGAWKQ